MISAWTTLSAKQLKSRYFANELTLCHTCDSHQVKDAIRGEKPFATAPFLLDKVFDCFIRRKPNQGTITGQAYADTRRVKLWILRPRKSVSQAVPAFLGRRNTKLFLATSKQASHMACMSCSRRCEYADSSIPRDSQTFSS